VRPCGQRRQAEAISGTVTAVSRPPHVPAQLRRRAFRGSAAVRAGLLTKDQLRSPAWRPLFRDVYAHTDLEVTHSLRARAAALLVAPGAVVTGTSAAALWGVDLGEVEDDVELTVPPGSPARRVRGVRVRRAALPTGLVRLREGAPVTSPAATAVRVATCLPHDDAVAAVDRMVVAGLAPLAAVRDLAARSTGRGAARARAVCALADGLAGSPQETRLRLLIGRSDLPTPVAQHTVRDEAGFVARVDLAWPGHRVAVEYDGLWHAEPGQFARDRQRLNRLTAAGWRVVFVTAADLHRPVELVARIRAALAG
jgi:hypothetical protein